MNIFAELDAWTLVGAGGTLLMCYLLVRLLMPAPQSHNGLPLPPFSPAPGYENFTKKISQQGLARVLQVTDQGRIMHARDMEKDKDAFKYGTAYRMNRVPLIENNNVHIYVTDYKLARTVLLGDKSRGISEGIKKNSLNSFNIANRNVGNLFT